nr:RNA-directed DNA polymerase, eukaryota [Tanacetum cinerariifolium]
GPDGFSFSFFRHFWSTIEKDIFEAVDYFFTNGDMPNGCKSTFIALIPKIIDANMVKDFRPISLIGSLYKVIAKILTNRLLNVIGDLVNVVQSVFVAERQILNEPFILNERVVDGGLFMGIKLNSMVNLSHLFYADDAIFIGQWSELNVHTLVQVLECFYRASGLRINMCKSKIMGVNVEDGKIQNAASKLGCLVLKTLFTYLGTKVGENMSRKEAWKEAVDKVRFFNGQDHKSRKASWVKWDNVLTSRDKGGLGVAILYALNRGWKIPESSWGSPILAGDENENVKRFSNEDGGGDEDGDMLLSFLLLFRFMGSYRSKVDDVNRISTSIFVTNFPESFSAKDLFQSCKQYGHVVDSYSIKEVERGFQRVPLNSNKVYETKNVESFRGGDQISRKDVGGADSGKSFVNVVKSIYKSGTVDCEANPAIVLDDDCLNSKDLTNSLLGRVKEFASLSNLKMILTNEGFVDISVRYMGELWVLLEFTSTKSKELFRDNVGVGSWFSELKQASFDFNPDGRVVWVEVEGVSFKFWSGNTFKRLVAKWGELLDVDDQEESCFHSKRLCLYTKFHMNIFENSKMIFRGKVFWVRAKEVPGWVPELLEESDEVVQSDDGSMKGDNKVQYARSSSDNSEVAEVPETNFDESIRPKVNLSNDPFGIYPLLNKNSKENKENVNEKDQSLEYPPGFTPNAEENDRNVNGDKSQKCNTKEVFAEGDGDSTNRGSKGDASESTPNAEENDRNVNGNKSQKCNTKEVFVGRDEDSINRGSKGDSSESVCTERFKKPEDGEVVIMGDFNEVRHKSDRFGLIFNGQGADEFNSFIANAGLEEVPLGGSAFTWCHKSTTKMNKLDRFLISENLFITCLHITATTLERYLSDHRPILLRETSNDYRPIREWSKSNRHSRTGMKEKYKEELRTLDDDIDNGNGSDTVVHKRMEVINALQRINKLNAMEIAQKTKIKWAVWDCGTDKSPGPDGFTFGFYRQFWVTIKNDVFEAVSHFFTNADLPKGCNPSFIALILKILDANKGFGDIVNEVQSAFIAERQSLDGPFILNEVLQWCKIKKKQSFIFKVDFEKAYDSVRWDFLDDVLKKFGFGNKWCDWIQTCLKSSRGSILINGSPTEEFQFCKGLKQGDPLSPFLFILIMEGLYLSFLRVVDAGLFMGIKLSHLVNLSHMFYAYDAVFVGQWSDSNINTLIHMLDCLYRASCLRMNMTKSKIMGVHVEGGMVKHAASKLGCLTLNTPFYYLGSKVGGSMSRVQAWKEVIDKVKSRISKWKMKALSIGGRQFFNGHEVGNNKATWVKWNSVLTAKDSGGLGMSSLYALNRGLMMKWVWRFYNQKTSLWANVIKAIHREDESM